MARTVVTRPRSPRSLRCDQVAEELPDDWNMILADGLEGLLAMLGERPADPADEFVGLARQEALLPVAVLPKPRSGKGQHGQRPALGAHFRHHLVDQGVVLEAVAALQGRLHEGAAQRRTRWWSKRRELEEHRRK